MTEEEKEILDLIVKAYNKFHSLERTHPSELPDFVDATHKLQSILGMRILRRDYPEVWITKREE